MKSITLLSILFLSACSIYKTEKTDSKTNHVAEGDGIYYFLPKAYLHIVAKEVQSTTTTTPKKTVEKTVTTTTGNEFPEKVTKITENYLKEAETSKNEPYQLNLKIVPSIEADVTKRYFLQHRTSYLSKDVVNLQTNKKGLLETVNTTTTDETGTVVVNLVKLIGGLPAAALRTSLTPELPEEPDPPIDIDIWIDPSSKKDICKLIAVFAGRGYCLSISPTSCPPAAEKPARDQSKYGIAFKSPTVYVVEIKPEKKSNQSLFRESYVLPSGDVGIYRSSPKRGFLIEKTTDLTIVDGMLTGISITKPSELAAFTGLPITIMDAIIGAFDGLVTIKVEAAKTETALLTEKVNQLKAEKDLIKTQQEIIKLQNPEPQQE